MRHLDDGTFEDAGVTHGGFRFFDAGHRALLETEDGHHILLTSRPMGNTSRAELTSVGLDPLTLQVIVAKGVHSPRGAYEPIAAEMIQLNTRRLHDGGSLVADLSAPPPADVPVRARRLVRPDEAGHLSARLRSGW